MTCSGVSQADALAASFRRQPWATSPVEPPLEMIELSALVDTAVGERAVVKGVVTTLEARA